ncbi:hypothetical protein [Nitrobacter vulgaris]|uniref:Uncharacterized protein n=1 Tax=Nitrobacter vulgaris TaxID=29421 RepID=A0A1V4I154_NITVU|nr:hypothetical protein [Nitrobacter vulgaris]OPH83968.1 hypothetical protein B2M20_04220 [Nitrobacter vulgaris]
MLATSCDPPGLFSLQVAGDVEVFHGPHVKLEGFIDSFFIIQPAYSEAEFGRLTTSWRPRRDPSGSWNKHRKSWYGRKIRDRTSVASSRSERTDDEALSAGLGAQS